MLMIYMKLLVYFALAVMVISFPMWCLLLPLLGLPEHRVSIAMLPIALVMVMTVFSLRRMGPIFCSPLFSSAFAVGIAASTILTFLTVNGKINLHR